MNTAQYQYAAISNLVLPSSRRKGAAEEPNGEPESLRGRVDFRQMGDRLRLSKRERVTEVDDGIYTTELNIEDLKGPDHAPVVKKDKLAIKRSILDDDEIIYKPRSKETETLFTDILNIVFKYLKDQSEEIIQSAADHILDVLKDDTLESETKRKDISDTLNSKLDTKEFASLTSIAVKITDHPRDHHNRNDFHPASSDEAVAIFVDEENDQDIESESHDDSEADDTEDVTMLEDHVNKESLNTTVIGETYSVTPNDIDAYWLQRYLSKYFDNPLQLESKTKDIFASMQQACQNSENFSISNLENNLMELFEFQNLKAVEFLMRHHQRIFWCTKLARAENDLEKEAISKELTKYELLDVLNDTVIRSENNTNGQFENMNTLNQKQLEIIEKINKLKQKSIKYPAPKQKVDIENFVFEEGSHLMSNKRVVLPDGTKKFDFKEYQEIQIPMNDLSSKSDEQLMKISDIPNWTHLAFEGIQHLNRIQTKIYPSAFESDENLLICAPTGAGKTNVATLCILREISKHRDVITGKIQTDRFKIVYIAPLKALVQEMVNSFTKKFENYNIKVSELTGDHNLTKQTISETQIIVTVPEKWDIITRKSSDLSYTNLVTLIIIDEIHLLHDDRGPVLESIVARKIRRDEQLSQQIRLVGLSATLPNYEDVALFLRVKHNKGLHYFDASYRPCPLKQTFLGITEKKPIKRLKAINNACYLKTMNFAANNQVLIFVHSRKETANTAKLIRDRAIEDESITKLVKVGSVATEKLKLEAEKASSQDLKELLPYGLAIHHAGMNRSDRTIVENLFTEGLIQVLVSTATLAWGVNLPAHTVIIKGTQVYSPEKGSWIELSPQDVLQMLGRAGRPQFDSFGEGIIITTQDELQYYLSLLNHQLPIESQLFAKLADLLNAEIVLGTVKTRDEAIQWLGYTYLFIRMIKAPGLYRVGSEYVEDLKLEQKRSDLIHSAALILQKSGLIKYDQDSGAFLSTEPGRIASHFYISHSTMSKFLEGLSPDLSTISCLRVFCRADEFKNIPVRQEEKLELVKLLENVPIPVAEPPDDRLSKVNTLLQCYISRHKLEGFALIADMVYITQSASRLLRALFDIAVSFRWAAVSREFLSLFMMVENQMWPIMTPLRQFKVLSPALIKSIERKDIPFFRYFEFNLEEIVELLSGNMNDGRKVFSLLRNFPRLELQAKLQTLSKFLIRIDLTVTPNFQWQDNFHGNRQTFHILVEDTDGFNLLYADYFVLKKRYINEEHFLRLDIPIQQIEAFPAGIIISLISDRWLGSESQISIPTINCELPQDSSSNTEFYGLEPLPIEVLRNPDFISLYSNNMTHLDSLQTQVFPVFYKNTDNVFLGCPASFDTLFCAELAILKHFTLKDHGTVIFISPFSQTLRSIYVKWSMKFSSIGKYVASTTGEVLQDLYLMGQNDILLCTPRHIDSITRRWRQREIVQSIDLVICDRIHFISGSNYSEALGSELETVLARLKLMSSQLNTNLRIIGLSLPITSSKDLARWIGAPGTSTMNFDWASFPIEKHIQSFTISHFPSFMVATIKPCYFDLKTEIISDPVSFSAIVFCPSRLLCIFMAEELINTSISDNFENIFTVARIKETEQDPEINVCNNSTKLLLENGIGVIHEAMPDHEIDQVLKMYSSKYISLLIISREMNYRLDQAEMKSKILVIAGTQFYDGRDHLYVNYSISEIMNMMGFLKISYMPSATNSNNCAKLYLLTSSTTKAYYKAVLEEPLPVESNLTSDLRDILTNEIAAHTIKSKQEAIDWLAETFFYKRLLKNPSYYGLSDVTQDGVSEYLSVMLEESVSELEKASFIQCDDESGMLSPLSLSMIASYYGISYMTLEGFADHLSEDIKLKGCLEVLSTAVEFEELLPIRKNEHILLSKIYEHLPIRLSDNILDFESEAIKAFIMITSHFSRFTLPVDLELDQSRMLELCPVLLHAMVDILASKGYLQAMIRPIKLCQMTIQACWDRSSVLEQVPYFDDETIQLASDFDIKSIYDFQELADESIRDKILKKFNQTQKNRIAQFVNAYPMIDMTCKVDPNETIKTGKEAKLEITLDRGLDESEEDWTDQVVSEYFQSTKNERWYVLISDQNELLGLKKVSIPRDVYRLSIPFTSNYTGNRQLRIMLLCDSYIGCDIESYVEVMVSEK